MVEIKNYQFVDAATYWTDRYWRKQAGDYTALAEVTLAVGASRVEGWQDDDPQNGILRAGDAMGRFLSAARIISDAIFEGNLEFALTEMQGGEFLKQIPETELTTRPDIHNRKPHVWNIENPFFRFMFCQMSLLQPFSIQPRGTHRIWIKSDRLASFLVGSPKPAVNEEGQVSAEPSGPETPPIRAKAPSAADVAAAIAKCISFAQDNGYRMLSKDEAEKLIPEYFSAIGRKVSRDTVREIIATRFKEHFTNAPGPQTNGPMRGTRPGELAEFRDYLSSA